MQSMGDARLSVETTPQSRHSALRPIRVCFFLDVPQKETTVLSRHSLHSHPQPRAMWVGASHPVATAEVSLRPSLACCWACLLSVCAHSLLLSLALSLALSLSSMHLVPAPSRVPVLTSMAQSGSSLLSRCTAALRVRPPRGARPRPHAHSSCAPLAHSRGRSSAWTAL